MKIDTTRHYQGIKDVPAEIGGRRLVQMRRAELRRVAAAIGLDAGPQLEKRELIDRIARRLEQIQ